MQYGANGKFRWRFFCIFAFIINNTKRLMKWKLKDQYPCSLRFCY